MFLKQFESIPQHFSDIKQVAFQKKNLNSNANINTCGSLELFSYGISDFCTRWPRFWDFSCASWL